MTDARRAMGSSRETETGAPTLFFSPFRLDPANEQLWLGERRIALKPLTFQVLLYLAERPLQLVGKHELLQALWANVCVTEGVLKTQVKELRRRLGDTSRAPRFIETVHRRGYRFIAPVTKTMADPGGTLAPVRLEPGLASSAAIVVGRNGELAQLRRLWTLARGGERRLAFITGEPGIGKTTLVKTLLASDPVRGDALVASGQCVEQYGRGEAYLPFLEAFGRLCRNADTAFVADVLRLEAPTWWRQLSESHVASSASAPSSVTSAVPADRMLREMADAIPELTARCPLVIVLEDLHWADHSTLSLVSYLAQRAEPARFLMLGTYRGRDVRFSDHPLWSVLQLLESRGQAEEITLRQLAGGDVHAYLAARFPQAQLPPELANQLCGLTSGNPLFLTRVIDVLLERGLIEQQGEHWRFAGEISSITDIVPDRLVLLIAGETDRLTAAERSVLDAAAVAGFEFSVAALAAALERDVVELEDLCARWLREGRFFKRAATAQQREVGLRAEFLHVLYRQVLYQRLAPTLRQQLHLRIGLHEEGLHEGAPHPFAGRLALHFRLGGDPGRAVRYGHMAGEHALRRSAYREAIDHFSTALEVLKDLDDTDEAESKELELLVALSVPLLMINGYASAEVERVYLRAAQLCERQGGPLHLHVVGGMALFYLVRGNMPLSKEMGERLVTLAEARGDPDLQFDGHMAVGLASYFMGDFACAEQHLRPALVNRPREKRLASPSAFHPAPYLLGLCYLAKIDWQRGYAEQGLARAEEALELARRANDPFTLACILAHVVFIHKYRGDEQFSTRARELLALVEGDEFWFYGLYAVYHSAVATARGGNLEQGIEDIGRSWKRMDAAGVGLGACGFRLDLAEFCLQAGRFDDAILALRKAFEASGQTGERYLLPEVYRIYGEIARAAPEAARRLALSPGAPELDAGAAFVTALELARGRGAKPFELRAAMSLGRLWASQARLLEARQLVEGVYSDFGEGYATADLQGARALLDELAEALESRRQRSA